MTAKIYSLEEEKARRAPAREARPPSTGGITNEIARGDYTATAEDRAVAYARARKAADEANAAFAAEFSKRLPEGFSGVVVAELIEDDSDLYSDYHGHKTKRRVILGFTKTPRSLFGNMRKAAATFGPTAHLGGTRYADHEHRENYSMGGGMYLKHGSRHEDGWSIRIVSAEYVRGPAEFSPFLGE